MKNVTLPSQFLQELLALCGPEDHELRERVLKSAAPAHPAEGVPALTETYEDWVAGLGFELDAAADGVWQVIEDTGARREANLTERVLWKELIEMRSALAATQPAAQGLVERDEALEAVRKAFCKLQRYSFFLDSRGNVRRCADHCGNWVEFEAVHTLFEPQAVDAALAAQAKQGGAV